MPVRQLSTLAGQALDGGSGGLVTSTARVGSTDVITTQQLRKGATPNSRHEMSQWWHLWHHWWAGEQLTGGKLWGHSLIFWARFGKLLQFLSGLTVILDLIGADPLRAFGRRLLRVSWRRGVSKPAEKVAIIVFYASLLGYLVFLVLLFTSDFFRVGQEMVEAIRPWGERLDQSWLGYLACFGAILLFIVAMSTILTKPGKSKDDYKGDVLAVFFLMPVVVVAGLALMVLLLPWVLFIYAFCLPVSRGLAALLDGARPGHPLRWTALAMFVVGFHFDLLAS